MSEEPKPSSEEARPKDRKQSAEDELSNRPERGGYDEERYEPENPSPGQESDPADRGSDNN
jgi:hypothetical protein